jgi:hypothetical protein
MRSRWQQHAGEYRAASGGTWLSVLVASDGLHVRLKLHLRTQGLRLTEFRPNVFLTPDGRAVRFEDGRMDLGGIQFIKQA